MRCDLPSPEEVTHDTSDVEMREPSARNFEPRDLVEEERYGGFVRRCLLIFVACGDGFSGFAIGEEARLESRNELDKEDLLGQLVRAERTIKKAGKSLLRWLQ